MWRAVRGPVAILGVIVAAGVVIALVRGGGGGGGSLEPDSVAPSGRRALARLLGAQGVRVETVHTAKDAEAAVGGGSATLLITRPEWVRVERLTRLRAAEVVLVAPPRDVLSGEVVLALALLGLAPLAIRMAVQWWNRGRTASRSR